MLLPDRSEDPQSYIPEIISSLTQTLRLAIRGGHYDLFEPGGPPPAQDN